MTLAATVNAEAAAVERAAMKTPRKKHVRQEHRRCIYCEIVVGEVVALRGGHFEGEGYTETNDGLVCDYCMADPLAKERTRMGIVLSERRLAYNAQCRQIDSRTLSEEERAVRDTEIIRLHALGKCYAEIGELVGLSVSGVGNRLKTIRRWRDREIVRLAGEGWSQQRIANKVGLGNSMIGKIINRTA